jgi:hypothetical protein
VWLLKWAVGFDVAPIGFELILFGNVATIKADNGRFCQLVYCWFIVSWPVGPRGAINQPNQPQLAGTGGRVIIPAVIGDLYEPSN